MSDPEIKKRIQRFFFALDHFYENGLSEYWLQEMKTNRRLIEEHYKREEETQADQLQTKINFK